MTIPVVILFLTVGSGLWLHYGGSDGVAQRVSELATSYGISQAKAKDYVFPAWVIDALPAGIKGLIFAGLFAAAMSSLDSAIAALSSTAVKNVWEPYVDPGRDERHYLRVSRWMAVVFGLVLVTVAVIVWSAEDRSGAKQGFGVLMLGLKVLTWIFPPLLGVFLVGVLTTRGRDRTNLIALGAGIALLMTVEFWGEIGGGARPFSWVWNSMVGCLVTFAIAAMFAPQEVAE
jgi:Na+/proline symporter